MSGSMIERILKRGPRCFSNLREWFHGPSIEPEQIETREVSRWRENEFCEKDAHQS